MVTIKQQETCANLAFIYGPVEVADLPDRHVSLKIPGRPLAWVIRPDGTAWTATLEEMRQNQLFWAPPTGRRVG